MDSQYLHRVTAITLVAGGKKVKNTKKQLFMEELIRKSQQKQKVRIKNWSK